MMPQLSSLAQHLELPRMVIRRLRLLLALAAVLFALQTTNSACAQAAISRNIVTDFGAKCDGVSDDSSAFWRFNTWAVANQGTDQVVLTIPSGSRCTLRAPVTRFWVKGIKNLLVLGYGAAISGDFFLGGRGQYQDNAHSARLATVSAGASSVQLLLPRQVSLFAAGRYALITGFDLQGLWQSPYGYPSNPHFFEYVMITGVDSARGIITFATPLKNTYESTWPNYNSGSRFEVDSGGPATLYALDPSWDTQVEYRGLTIARPGQTYANGRSVTYRDVAFTGGGCGIPTQNLSWTAINVSMADCTIEADKLVGTVTFTGGTVKAIDFQSSSIDLLVMNGTKVTSYLHGTPKRSLISNATIAEFWPGAWAYGRTDEVSCINCVLKSFNIKGILEKGKRDDTGVTKVYTMSNGVIIVPNQMGAVRWAVPGTNLMWDGAYESETAFHVIDVTQDANNTYVKTDLPGGFPAVPLYHNAILYIRVHPAPKFTCSGCIGSPDVLDLARAPAAAPLYSYSKRTYNGSLAGNAPPVRIWGKLVKMTVTVSPPYSGPTSNVSLNPIGQFHGFTIKADGSVFDYVPTINLNMKGSRIVTPVSVSGQKPGDAALTVPEPIWFSGMIVPHMNGNISGESVSNWPTITIEIVTDQGVVRN